MRTNRKGDTARADHGALHFLAVALLCGGAVIACSTDSGGNATPSKTEDESSSDVSSGTETDLHPDSDSSSETEAIPEDTEAGPFARGISITHLEANQGAAVYLIERGTVISPENRKVGLIMGRPLLLRAYWERGKGFRNRSITAELALHFPDDSDEVQPVTLHVAGVSNAEQLDGTFTWHIEKERVLPGVTYQITLKEAEAEFVGAASPPSGALLPASGPAELGVVNLDTVLKIVMVPFQPLGGEAVVVSNSDKKTVEDTLLELSGVARVAVTWKAPVLQTAVYTRTDEPWDALSRMRDADGAGPEVYYHGLLNKNGCCEGDDFNFTGLGGLAGDTQSAADVWARNSIFPIGEAGVGRAALPIVHELGHNQGRRHAPCGDGADPDPDFPYPSGGIGRQGWGILSDELYSAARDTARPYSDIMGYCQPAWYSDYNFEAIRIRAATLSSWGLRRQVFAAAVPVLKVTISPTGFSYHFTRAEEPAETSIPIPKPSALTCIYNRFTGETVPLRVEEIPMPDHSLLAAVIYLPASGMAQDSMVEVRLGNRTFIVFPPK